LERFNCKDALIVVDGLKINMPLQFIWLIAEAVDFGKKD